MQPEAACSSTPDYHSMALSAPRTAAAILALALRLDQCLHSSLSPSVAESGEIGGKHHASTLHIGCSIKSLAPPP
jgi:hypothetical protein